MTRNALLLLAAVLIVLWALGWLFLRIATFAIHILLGLGIVLLILALIRRVSSRRSVD